MAKIPLSSIILDEVIYPREKIDHKRAFHGRRCRCNAEKKDIRRDQSLCGGSE